MTMSAGKKNKATVSRWANIPQFPRAHYEVDVPWNHIERSLTEFSGGVELRLDPDYQRMHVWTETQQSAYIEYVLRGGEVGRNLTWNALGWPSGLEPIELVDGKQRLEAVRKFIRGELEVFGQCYAPGDHLRFTQASFRFRVCSLDRADVLRLYLNINAGGTPHTLSELDRVRSLLDAEIQR